MKFKSTRSVKNKIWLIWGEIGAALGTGGVLWLHFRGARGRSVSAGFSSPTRQSRGFEMVLICETAGKVPDPGWLCEAGDGTSICRAPSHLLRSPRRDRGSPRAPRAKVP